MAKDEDLPIVGTIASQFNDAGVNHLFELICHKLEEKTGISFKVKHTSAKNTVSKTQVIPPARVRYLAEIAEAIEQYDTWADEQSANARQLYQLQGVIDMFEKTEKN
jgi:methylmalonyl-CoA mutase